MKTGPAVWQMLDRFCFREAGIPLFGTFWQPDIVSVVQPCRNLALICFPHLDLPLECMTPHLTTCVYCSTLFGVPFSPPFPSCMLPLQACYAAFGTHHCFGWKNWGDAPVYFDDLV